MPGQAEQPARQVRAVAGATESPLHAPKCQGAGCGSQGGVRHLSGQAAPIQDRLTHSRWSVFFLGGGRAPPLFFLFFLSPFIYPPTSMRSGACAGRVRRSWTISAKRICMGNSKNRLPPRQPPGTGARGSVPCHAWDCASGQRVGGACRAGEGALGVGGELRDACRVGALPYTSPPTYPTADAYRVARSKAVPCVLFYVSKPTTQLATLCIIYFT